MRNEFLETFNNPGSSFRSSTFWGWNSKMDHAEMRRQIGIMHKMGIGGFFIHGRVGLVTPYLSDEWFECVKVCVEEARRLDMHVWIYDEDKWNSGTAGGEVTKNHKYRRHYLICHIHGSISGISQTDSTVAFFAARLDESGKLLGYRKISDIGGCALSKGETLLHYFIREEHTSEWHNNQTYVDTLNVDAIKEFVRQTHEKYKKHVGGEFGKLIPGAFTDEGNFFGGGFAKASNEIYTQWTEKLPKIFLARYGYDIRERLPELAYDKASGEISQARYHYFDCLTHLFSQALGKVVYDWCENNHIAYTGHILCEDTLSMQSLRVGSCMRFYEYMQIPGMDVLTEYWNVYDTAKQVSSAARQFGRKWRISECYAGTGWDFTFSGQKAIGDWQAALGINIRSQHISLYSTEGQAKRDYPPSIFFQSPWWDAYNKVEDYFARINSVMSRGKEIRDILVIHPIESMWTMLGKDRNSNPSIGAFDNAFMTLREILLNNNMDFDYGDEELLSRFGNVSKIDGEPVLKLNMADYKAVILPPMKTIRETTLDLISEFKRSGGIVIFTGEIPEYVDALKSDLAIKFATGCERFNLGEPVKIIESMETKRRVSITDYSGRELRGLLHLLKEDDDDYYLFICNTGLKSGKWHEKDYTPEIYCKIPAMERNLEYGNAVVRLFIDAKGCPLELDPDSGKAYFTDSVREKKSVAIKTDFPKLGSRLFVIPKKTKRTIPAKGRIKYSSEKTIRINKSQWDYSMSEENVFVLDFAEYRIGSSPWEKTKEILKIDSEIRKSMGVSVREPRMLQPWARQIKKSPSKTQVSLKYKFLAEASVSNVTYLAMERPEDFAISINGNTVSPLTDSGWWFDKPLRKIPLDPALICEGENELMLSCEYDEYSIGLEAMYILGNFGVKFKGDRPVISQPVEKLKIGDWCKQALPFYSGNLSYIHHIILNKNPNKDFFIKLPDYKGTAARIFINTSLAGIIAWGRNELDISKFIKNGKNEIRIEILGHRRNSHGPLHYSGKKIFDAISSDLFTCDNENWSDSYNLVPCGLMTNPEIIERIIK